MIVLCQPLAQPAGLLTDVFLGGTVCRGFSFGPSGGRVCIGMCAPDLLPGRAALCAQSLSLLDAVQSLIAPRTP